ncbi:MAG TPA: hypothetical protein VHC20_02905 [Candidatus Paceibacterota bacterium]|nr:hypothetical protein [Candidatus Paceibacterota bacterium]
MHSDPRTVIMLSLVAMFVLAAIAAAGISLYDRRRKRQQATEMSEQGNSRIRLVRGGMWGNHKR